MKKSSFRPNVNLSNYIDRFYIFKKSVSEGFNLPIVLPGTGLELLFHSDDTLSINNSKLDKGHIICPRKVFDFDKTTKAHFISVRFKSGAFRHFTSVPYSELNDTHLSITDIWGRRGVELMNKLNDYRTVQQKIRLIEDFLVLRLSENLIEKTEKWDAIIAALYGGFNTLSLKELSHCSNLGYRQFERNFKLQFGITPKHFQRITRLQDTVKKVLLNKSPYYMNDVLDNGYFDQSHFVNEFQNFVGLKPTHFFSKDNFKTNFYFRSTQYTG